MLRESVVDKLAAGSPASKLGKFDQHAFPVPFRGDVVAVMRDADKPPVSVGRQMLDGECVGLGAEGDDGRGRTTQVVELHQQSLDVLRGPNDGSAARWRIRSDDLSMTTSLMMSVM